jgi:hypothetical protein
MDVVPAGKVRKWQIIIWAAILTLAIFLSLRNYRTYQLGFHGDDAAYAVLARSLLGDRGYGLTYTPGPEPLPASFPFGFPLLLAPLAAWQPENMDVLKIPSFLATLANGALLFWGWRSLARRSGWWGLAVSGLYLLYPLAIDRSQMVMSEPVFTMLCLLGLLLTEQISQGRSPAWRAPLLGAVLAYAVYTRSVGLVVALAALAYLLWRLRRRAWRAIMYAGVAGLCLTGLVLLLTPVGPDGLVPARYLTESNNSLYLLARGDDGVSDDAGMPAAAEDWDQGRFGSPVLRVLDRVRRHLTTDLRRAMLPGGGGQEEQLADRLGIPWLSSAISLLLLIVVAIGCVAGWIADGGSAFLAGGVAYLAAVMLWEWLGARLLYPVLPQLLLCLLGGVGVIGRVALRRPARLPAFVPEGRQAPASVWLSGGPVVVVAVLLGCLSIWGSYRVNDSRLHVGDLTQRTAWLRANSPATAVVMTEQPAIDFLYGGRRTVRQPRATPSAADLHGLLVERGVDYVLIGPDLEWRPSLRPTYSRQTERLLPVVAELEAAGRLAEVYSSEQDRLVVLQVKSP